LISNKSVEIDVENLAKKFDTQTIFLRGQAKTPCKATETPCKA